MILCFLFSLICRCSDFFYCPYNKLLHTLPLVEVYLMNVSPRVTALSIEAASTASRPQTGVLVRCYYTSYLSTTEYGGTISNMLSIYHHLLHAVKSFSTLAPIQPCMITYTDCEIAKHDVGGTGNSFA